MKTPHSALWCTCEPLPNKLFRTNELVKMTNVSQRLESDNVTDMQHSVDDRMSEMPQAVRAVHQAAAQCIKEQWGDKNGNKE